MPRREVFSTRALPVCLIFVVAFGAITWAPNAAQGAQAAAHVSPCGPLETSHEIVEPPDVEMWNAPVDASGLHELILGVHRDHDRFCYRYAWRGDVYTVSPAIRVHRGERFALRIADDIVSRARGESVPSTALPACMPMTMPRPPAEHWVGYLNHVIDDRYFSMPAVNTNLHLHGFEGPASMENVFLSALSTPMHACEYDITIPSTQPPGTYLYHPHAHGASDVELFGGLSGVWIVEPDTPQIPRSDEHVIVLRYRMPYEPDNTFAPDEYALGPAAEAHEAALPFAAPVRYDPFHPPPWPVSYPMRVGSLTLDPTGCDGLASEAVMAVNGSDTPAFLRIPAGRTQLLRIVNATSDSAKLLVLRDAAGAPQQLRIVGLDGVPVSGDMMHPLAQYLPLDDVMLSPMSRADILLTAPVGATYTLWSEHYCQGKDGFYQMRRALLQIAATQSDDPATMVLTPVDQTDTPAARLVAFARKHPSLIHRRAITFTEYDFPKRGRVPEHGAYYITDTTNPNFREHPFWPVYHPGAMFPSNPDIVVKQGTIEEWYVINATMETHAFHIHQMAFVEERSFMGPPVTVDTIFVPVGKLLPDRRYPNYPLIKPSITRILLDFRHVPKGEFVFHCHMLFHEDHGMMGVIRVE